MVDWNNKEQVAKYQKEYREANKQKYVLASRKYRLTKGYSDNVAIKTLKNRIKKTKKLVDNITKQYYIELGMLEKLERQKHKK